MKLQKLHIKNFKSIVDLEILEPNPFTVFVGPNGSGKSNIFEALEFVSSCANEAPINIIRGMGGINAVSNRANYGNSIYFEGKFEDDEFDLSVNYSTEVPDIVSTLSRRFPILMKQGPSGEFHKMKGSFETFFKNFSRVFVKSDSRAFKFSNDDTKINFASITKQNLEKVLKRILQDEVKLEEIKEWLDLFIPGFENIEIVSSELSGTDTLVMYEKGIKKPFTKDLLSDGTYNILALLTAVYQSDEPQFLCIEEPENGLNPYVVRALAEFFRLMCADKGHYIWLNTHSQSLVSELREEEMILVDKIEGETKIRQFKKGDFYGLRADEAWLTNALGGGLPW